MSDGPALPSLSVIMPTFNMAHYLPESLGAILAQSVRPLEILVLDDASTDDTAAAVERLSAGRPELVLRRNNSNLGVVRTVNQALPAARGEWIHFAAADDRILPGFYERLLGLAARHPPSAVCSCLCRTIGPDGRAAGSPVPAAKMPEHLSPADVAETLLRRGNWFNGPGSVFRRQALAQIGGFFEEAGWYSDGLASWLIALRHGCCQVPEILAEWRVDETADARRDANTSAKLRMIQACHRIVTERFGDLVPRAFADSWTRARCWSLLGLLQDETRKAERAELLRFWPRSSWMDRLFAEGYESAPRRALHAAYYRLRIKPEAVDV